MTPLKRRCGIIYTQIYKLKIFLKHTWTNTSNLSRNDSNSKKVKTVYFFLTWTYHAHHTSFTRWDIHPWGSKNKNNVSLYIWPDLSRRGDLPVELFAYRESTYTVTLVCDINVIISHKVQSPVHVTIRQTKACVMQDDDTGSLLAVTHTQDLKLSTSDTPSSCSCSFYATEFSKLHHFNKRNPHRKYLFKQFTGYSQQLDILSTPDIPTLLYSHMSKLNNIFNIAL